MPLLFKSEMEPRGIYGVWQNQETDAYFLSGMELFEAEIQELNQLGVRKKSEWLCSRYLLHQLTGTSLRGPCLKDTFGKPYIEGSARFISISHTSDFTAAIVHDQAVGIDIQRIVEKIIRIAPKFVNALEMEFIPADNHVLYSHVIWGAKEAIYKAYGRKALDFKQHMTISPFVFNADGFYFKGALKKDGYYQNYHLFCRQTEQIILVYAVEI